eukprot:403369028
MKWLQNRFYDRAKKEYILNSAQIKETLAMETLFIRFDKDKSGTLEMQELINMFRENQINISEKIIRELFRFADEDLSGTLTLDEFKSLLTNQRALDRFRELMIKERQKIQSISSLQNFSQNNKNQEGTVRFLPTDLRDMLKLLVNRIKYNSLQKKLEDVQQAQRKIFQDQGFNALSDGQPLKLNEEFFSMDSKDIKQKVKNLDDKSRPSSNEDFERNLQGTRYLKSTLRKQI